MCSLNAMLDLIDKQSTDNICQSINIDAVSRLSYNCRLLLFLLAFTAGIMIGHQNICWIIRSWSCVRWRVLCCVTEQHKVFFVKELLKEINKSCCLAVISNQHKLELLRSKDLRVNDPVTNPMKRASICNYSGTYSCQAASGSVFTAASSPGYSPSRKHFKELRGTRKPVPCLHSGLQNYEGSKQGFWYQCLFAITIEMSNHILSL